MSGQAILAVRDLAVGFGSGDTGVQAVRGVSFTLDAGEIMGIVGESGSGKSVTCRALLGLLPASARVTGEARFDGQDLLACSEAELRRIRGRQISMIFQNPASHLDPLMTVGRHVAEPLRFHFDERRPRAREAAIDLLRAVHIQEPERRIDSYPHELSGGMKQRALIASAIACRPRLLLADEPTTALDVTVQARILELLRELNRRHGLSIILVSHDLGVIAETCDRVAVLYAGRVAEVGPVAEVIHRPAHPYTVGLMGSIPAMDEDRDRLLQIDGAMPRLNAIPSGCAFNPRCPQALARCRRERPELMTAGATRAACWLVDRAAGAARETA